MSALDTRVLADVATGLWRARRGLATAGAAGDTPAVAVAARHVQRTLDVLAEAGVEVVDHQDRDYVTGSGLEVLAFQPVAGLARETVVEVLRPMVYADGVLIQRGEVIVGVPPGEDGGTA
jgi:hypothetical protein